MAIKEFCFITTSEEGRGAYGITKQSEEKVYFPVGLSDAMELEEFEEVEAILVTNDRKDPPWKAIHVRRVEGLKRP